MSGGVDGNARYLSGGGTFPPPQTAAGGRTVSECGELCSSSLYYRYRAGKYGNDAGQVDDGDTSGHDALCGARSVGRACKHRIAGKVVKKGEKNKIIGIFAQKLHTGFINVYKMLKRDCQMGHVRSIIRLLKTLPVTIPDVFFVQNNFLTLIGGKK